MNMLVINKNDVDKIKEIALNLWKDTKVPPERELLLFKALEIYLRYNDATVFKVDMS